jgi:hypothetical protein
MHTLESLLALPWLYLPGEGTRAPYSCHALPLDRDGQATVKLEAFEGYSTVQGGKTRAHLTSNY